MDQCHNVLSLVIGHSFNESPHIDPDLEYFADGGEGDFECRSVSISNRRSVKSHILDAFHFCGSRIPLSHEITRDTHVFKSSVDTIRVGNIVSERYVISASSPDDIGLVFIAAPWASVSREIIAGQIIHEYVHQMLYMRECANDFPVRPNAIGYSPWKVQERPGRWVWHSFWSFCVQFTLLCDAVMEQRRVWSEAELHFLGNMYACLTQTLESLQEFKIVGHSELLRCDEAANIAKMVNTSLANRYRSYYDFVEIAQDTCRKEKHDWAVALLKRYRG